MLVSGDAVGGGVNAVSGVGPNRVAAVQDSRPQINSSEHWGSNVDLAGKPHNVGGVDIPTPHTVEFGNNIITSGPRAGQIGSRSPLGPTRPATAEDLRIVERWLRSKGF